MLLQITNYEIIEIHRKHIILRINMDTEFRNHSFEFEFTCIFININKRESK